MISRAIAYALGIALAAALAGLGIQSFRLSVEQRDHAQTREAHAVQREDWQRETRVAVEAARTEEQRRTAAVQKEANEADQARFAAESNAAAAVDVSQRLRGQLAALTARLRGAAGSPTAPVAGPGVQGADALDLLAGMLIRHSAELVEVGSYADRLRIAGLACERSWDQLTAPP